MIAAIIGQCTKFLALAAGPLHSPCPPPPPFLSIAPTCRRASHSEQPHPPPGPCLLLITNPTALYSTLWAGSPKTLVLFETLSGNSKGRTTCLGHCNEQCQADFHNLLGECEYVIYDIVS